MEFLSDVGGGQDHHRPSFFELAAQEQLRDLLAPVVRYVLSVFAQRNPRYLLRIVNRHDEFFALVMFFVERHYLKAWGASFAENFYGLKRRRVLGTGGDKTRAAVELTGQSEKLGKREIRMSLVFLILVPYLRSKAQDLYERLGGGVDSDLFSDTPASAHASFSAPRPLTTRVKEATARAFKTLYPYVNTSYELYLLSYNVRYLFDKTPYWRPWLDWMGVEVRRMSAEDYHNAHQTTSTLLSSPLRRLPGGLPPSYSTIFLRSLSLAPLLTFEALKFLLPTSIFFFRFLEWWYSPDGGSSRLRGKGGGKGSSGAALRAPTSATATATVGRMEGLKTPPGKGVCPVHEGPLVNPTALPTGWVGCYKCLHTWVEEKGCCP
ncbi:Pex12 amino terminal region-domain-containing protein, partial [Leucosporidium creatinivorum]